MTTSLIKTYLKLLWDLPSPSNLSYFWGFGSILGIIIVIQVITGFILAFYYIRGIKAWESIVEITREVYAGWVIRLIHRNTASFVFIVLFVHFSRGLSQASFYLKGPWIRGWVIILITMAAAFLGYVLPWGQISFWGATVIINLLRVLPKGKILVIWLWGGFYVSSFTCRFFFALHFIVPFIVLIIAAVHLILLHSTGRSRFSGRRNIHALKIKFGHLFSFKDIVNISLLWLMWIFILFRPDWAADPINFVKSDLSTSPLHIQPEWYFLHYYAILRSIPNKLGGLIAFGLAFFILLFLRTVNANQRIINIISYPLLNWRFIRINLILIWLGSQAVEEPFTRIGLIITYLYFLTILIFLIIDSFRILLFDTTD